MPIYVDSPRALAALRLSGKRALGRHHRGRDVGTYERGPFTAARGCRSKSYIQERTRSDVIKEIRPRYFFWSVMKYSPAALLGRVHRKESKSLLADHNYSRLNRLRDDIEAFVAERVRPDPNLRGGSRCAISVAWR